MAVSQATATGFGAMAGVGETAAPAVRAAARMAGIGLLVGLASLIVLYGGSGAIAGSRPDHAADAATVGAFWGHSALTFIFWQAAISGLGVALFAIGFRRYLAGFEATPAVRLLAEFGAAIALAEVAVVIVELGMQAALVQLSTSQDPALLGVFKAWTWIDNGGMLVLELTWLATLSYAALRSGALPRALASFGLVIAGLMVVFAMPALLLGYPDGLTFVAYGPFIAWFLITGIYLARGGRAVV